MKIELKGFEQLHRAFHQAPQLVAREMDAWMQATGLHMQREVQARTPKRDGTLQKSIDTSFERVGTLGVSAVIGTPLNYAQPVEFGAKPHEIVAKNGKALHFFMRGMPVFAKKVQHPGSKGAFMFTKAFEANRAQIEDDFERLVEHILEKIAAGAR